LRTWSTEAEPLSGQVDRSLYDLLAEPVPSSVQSGETSQTATKETVDRDREESDGTILFESH
jgi:hypothetical protein